MESKTDLLIIDQKKLNNGETTLMRLWMHPDSHAPLRTMKNPKTQHLPDTSDKWLKISQDSFTPSLALADIL